MIPISSTVTVRIADYKRDLYEGGVRAPFVVNWPDKIKERRTVDNVTTFWDFLPTMTELVGAKPIKDIDGISYFFFAYR